jgi:AcrR family transcriptional regulator
MPEARHRIAAPILGLMPRDTLTREQIVRAAVEILDTEGVDGLSMRRLGTRLGSAATAVYWHVKSKDDLVVLAGDEVWGEVAMPDVAQVGWRAAAATMARDTYAMLLRHLWLVPAMSTHLIYGPGKARHDEHTLAVWEAAGFKGAEVDHAATAVLTFVVGTALAVASDAAWRARLRREGGDVEARVRETMESVAEIAVRFPHLKARLDVMEGVASGTLPDASFEFGLEAILDGLETRLAVRSVSDGPRARRA